MAKNNTTVFWLLAMAMLAVSMQFFGYIDLDDAWLLDVAQRVVNGEVLNVQVVETNPPLIVYIMMLPVLAAKALHVSAIYSYIIFTALVGLISCTIIFTQVKDPILRIVLAFGIFLLPNEVFGEREHFFMMLVLPYLISQTEPQKPPIAYSIIAGLMAGIGFSIKPFFCIIWLVIVAAKLVADRKIFSVENFLIGGFGVGYLAYLFFIEHDYVNNVLPLLLKYYSTFGANTWEAVKQAAKLIFVYQVATLILFIKDRKLLDRRIGFSCAACVVSVLLVVIQSKTWLNYFYPPLFFSLLSNTFVIFALFPYWKPLWNKAALAISCITIIVLLIFSTIKNVGVGFGPSNDLTARIVKIFNKKAGGKTVYAISMDLGGIYSQVIYSEAHNQSRYGHLWMLPGMYVGQPVKDGEIVYRRPGEMSADEAKFYHGVIAELIKLKPKLVIVVTPDHDYVNDGVTYKFDFLKYFGADPEFRNFWQRYKKFALIDGQDYYERQAEQ